MPTPDPTAPPLDLVIVGGGAAGLTAALFARQFAPNRSVLILDAAKTLGAKILVAGGGRCNVTHHAVAPADFNATPHIVRNILAAFDVPKTIAWFQSLGVSLKQEDTGKLFPTTDSAKTVLNALLNRCQSTGVQIQTAAKVQSISINPDQSFTLHHIQGNTTTRKLLLATGGRSLPKTGSDGSGYILAQALRHTLTPTSPALTALVLHPDLFHARIAGISHQVQLTTTLNHKTIDRRTGNLLWTHFGISGPVVMDASRHWTVPQDAGQSPKLFANLLPTETFETLDRWLVTQIASRPKTTLLNLLTPRLPERVVEALLSHQNIDPKTPAAQLPRDTRRALAHALTALPLQVQQQRGWNYAEVTAGGVPLDEINFRTMESKLTPNLYLAGEILDCDGRIGGFNFQWAWATGHLAGKAAAAP